MPTHPDHPFNALVWCRQGEGEWRTTLEVPLLHKLGRNIRLQGLSRRKPRSAKEAVDLEHTVATRKLLVVFESAGPIPRKPGPAQKTAWSQFMTRSPALWQDLLEKAFAEYRRNYPFRLLCWKALHGNRSTQTSLPAPTDLTAFTPIIRPILVRVRTPIDDTSDVAIWILSTYGGFGAHVRHGRIIRLHPHLQCFESQQPSTPHPQLGQIAPCPKGWETQICLRSFRNLHGTGIDQIQSSNLSEDTAYDTPYCTNSWAWDLCQGNFPLDLLTRRNSLPSPAQLRAINLLKKHQHQLSRDVMNALFQYYIKAQPRSAPFPLGLHPDDLHPPIKNPSAIADLCRLDRITALPQTRNGIAPLLLRFICSWDDRDTAVLLHGITIVRVGPPAALRRL